ncbi:hypothetical protein ACIQZN_08265 [Streptomyces sp. NPDC097595]|uniref:hypothetical protein n=1 Tax=Streptomyces sp. NPDC097595 TaxID=3366090 RepID=UPI0037FC6F5A
MGLTADASAAAFFLLSADVQAWLKENYSSVSIAALLLVAVTITLANSLMADRAEMGRLRAEVATLNDLLATPSRHDIEMFSAVSDQASPQGTHIVWLREHFLASHANTEAFHEFEKMIKFFQREPRGFDNVDLNGAYREFLSTGRELVEKMEAHMWYEGSGCTRLEIPREWQLTQPERWQQAITEIAECRDSFMTAYDSLFRMAQSKHFMSPLSVSPSPSSSAT